MSRQNRLIALIPISQHFSIRYFILTGMLQGLAEHVNCVLILGWKDVELEKELQQLGLRWVYMPQIERGNLYREIRRWANPIWEMDMATSTTAIDRRRVRERVYSLREKLFYFRDDVRRGLAALIGSNRLGKGVVEYLEDKTFFTNTNWRPVEKLIKDTKPDLIISSTPFIGAEAFFCRVAKHLGVKVLATVLSFDNLTSRGKIELIFDHYSVWNSFMKQEAIRIYKVSEAKITIDGAPQMDFYAWPDLLYPKDRFLEMYKLDGSRPIILFGAGAEHIAPVEPHILVQLDEIVSAYPDQQRPQILLRPHPVDEVNRWEKSLQRCRHVTLAPAWQVEGHTAGRINLDDIAMLATTLAYTDVHISTSSTMSLDGAIFDKPQIGLAYDDRPGQPLDQAMVELYEREHFLPLIRSGGIRLVRSRDKLAAALTEYLQNPGLDREARSIMVSTLCEAPIGKATEKVVNTILNCLPQESPVPVQSGNASQTVVFSHLRG